jgi:very-short-patch-repair endonuclease
LTRERSHGTIAACDPAARASEAADSYIVHANMVVEADGAAWHDNAIARTEDAERQALREAHGDIVLRVTWSQAVTKAGETMARIEAAGPSREAPHDRKQVSPRRP